MVKVVIKKKGDPRQLDPKQAKKLGAKGVTKRTLQAKPGGQAGAFQRKPKNARAKRALKERESKVVEGDRGFLCMRGTSTNETITEVLKDLVRFSPSLSFFSFLPLLPRTSPTLLLPIPFPLSSTHRSAQPHSITETPLIAAWTRTVLFRVRSITSRSRIQPTFLAGMTSAHLRMKHLWSFSARRTKVGNHLVPLLETTEKYHHCRALRAVYEGAVGIFLTPSFPVQLQSLGLRRTARRGLTT